MGMVMCGYVYKYMTLCRSQAFAGTFQSVLHRQSLALSTHTTPGPLERGSKISNILKHERAHDVRR
jgi:hypothetical protein